MWKQLVGFWKIEALKLLCLRICHCTGHQYGHNSQQHLRELYFSFNNRMIPSVIHPFILISIIF